MKFDVQILQAENGYIVLEGRGFTTGNGYQSRQWVAKDANDLGELIKKLAVELSCGPADAAKMSRSKSLD